MPSIDSPQPDFARIKRNVSKMIDLGAPESDIDAYLDEEGVTAAQLRAHSGSKPSTSTRNITVTFTDGSTHVYRKVPASITPEQVTERAEREFGLTVTHLDGGRSKEASKPRPDTSAPKALPSPDAREVIRSVFPEAEITDWKRPADSALGRANPGSWHVRSGGAVDMRPIPGVSFPEALEALKQAGIPVIEALDEVSNPSGHATGPHWHFVLGSPSGDMQPNVSPEPEGSEVPVTPTSHTPAASPSPVTPQQARDEENSFFRMPTDWGEFTHGLAVGTGNVVEGIADVPGIVLDPINTLVGRAMGYDGYTADFGKTVRESLGLPEDNTLTGDVIKGASGGLGMAGASRLLAKAGSGVVAKGLEELGSTPVRDAVGGAGAALGSGLAEEAGMPKSVQVLAGLAGGASSALGIKKAATEAPRLLDTPTAERLVPKIAQERFAARQAMNKYARHDRAISLDVEKIVSAVKESSAKPTGKKLTKAQKGDLLSRVSTLEDSYLPYAEVKALDLPASTKARLGKALDNRHILGDEEIDALADGTAAGDAVSDAIRKARRLRALVPEVAGRSSPSAASFLAEALGGTLGYKLGGFWGSAAGAAAGRKLTRSEVNSAAEAAAKVAADAPKFAKMPEETFGAGAYARDALDKLASETMDAPYVAKQEAERLAAEGRKVGIANDRDNIRPGGGWRGYVYSKTGLLPADQDAGALAALKDGKITPEQFQAHLDAPDKLMASNAGNGLVDRLAAMADEGTLKRDPEWSPPQALTETAPMVDAQGNPIRSLPAYQAGAAKNIARELQLLKELDEIDPVRGQLGDDGPAFRDSDLGALSAEASARAAALRAELAKMKPVTKGKAQ